MKRLLLFVIAMMLIANMALSDIIHVPGDYPRIQAGIDVAQHGDTVLVANGTYTGISNRDLDFKGKAIIVTSENGAESCIIDCEGTSDEPHRGFYFHSGETNTSVIDGFTIRNGYGWGAGGGIYCKDSSPAIVNNIIMGNSALVYGGGIYCYSGSSPMIVNNIITGNSAGLIGGGISCEYDSSPTIVKNTIMGNSTEAYGGGIYCCYTSSPTIVNNTIIGNSTVLGGGIYCHGSSPSLSNNTISSNYADDHGGGIYCQDGSFPTLVNCILWDDYPQEIYLYSEGNGNDPSDVIASYSDIQGGWPGEGNIDADPLFIDPDSDYHLSNYSPCIGAGIMTPDVPDTDIEGNPRPNPPGSHPPHRLHAPV